MIYLLDVYIYIFIYLSIHLYNLLYYFILHHYNNHTYTKEFTCPTCFPTCKICTCDVSGSRKARRFGEPPPLLGDAACVPRDLGDADGVRPPGGSQAPSGGAGAEAKNGGTMWKDVEKSA